VALGTQTPEAIRAAHSVRIAVIALLAVAVAAGALWTAGRLGAAPVAPEELSRVLLVGAAPDETGDVVAQVIAIADVRGGVALEPVSPATSVTIPGTTYSTIADAHPFGGGAGVAEAFARRQGGEPLPYVALNARALAAALEREGSISLDLPAPMSVFDGEDLFTLSAGSQALEPAEIGAVFKGAPYLSDAVRSELDAELCGMLAQVIISTPYPEVDTDLTDDAYAALQAALSASR
jgi:hypothetical protein